VSDAPIRSLFVFGTLFFNQWLRFYLFCLVLAFVARSRVLGASLREKTRFEKDKRLKVLEIYILLFSIFFAECGAKRYALMG
jgi:hypothetical protein